ncbi:hypothetical protein Ddye_022457 [Dipteronia dyeriana]|uniref:DUF1985 domain-containing protein n=1 Tax=Dipteronia dyeriana TaxID=168575 RepID=A0AAD9U410_9ROSI|nr:hypothetical protein Ddye_022457 [Dipteronia dyeriana]
MGIQYISQRLTEMTSMLKELLKTPEGDWFKGKLTRHDHFEALARIDDALNRVPEEFTVEDRRRFMAFCFDHFISMHQELKFSGGVIHQLLLRELDHDGPTDEMRFLLENHVVRFSKVKFSLITGLRFGVVPDTSMYVAVENDIHQWYFSGHDEVSLDDLRVVLTRREFQQAYDTVKLCLIYMLNWILMAVDERLKIPVWQFRLVEDLNAFDAFLWGAHVYRHFIFSFKHALPRRHICFRGDPPTERRFRDLKGYKPFSSVRLPTVLDPTTSAVRPEEEGRGGGGGEGGRCIEMKPSDPTGPDFSGMDTGRSEQSPRRRKVWFTTPGTGTAIGDSRAGVGLDEEARLEHQLTELREALRKSEDDRQQ